MNIYGVELIETDDMVCRSYKDNGDAFEPHSMQAWRQPAMKPGAVCVDVGAYTGIYAIMAAQEGATVYAFEPNPANYERLVENRGINVRRGRLFAFHAAIGLENGMCQMTDLMSRPRLTSAGKIQSNPQGLTNMVTLDWLGLSRCDAIKIDVEGAEADVIAGAEDTIRKYRPLLIVEALTRHDRTRLDEIMACYGYDLGRFVDGRNMVYQYAHR